METTDLVAQARAQIAAGDLKAAAYHAYALRNRARDMLARLYLSVTPEAVSPESGIDWTQVKAPADPDAPLTHDEVARFFGAKPPRLVALRFCQLFDFEDDGWPVAPDDLLKILLEVAPAWSALGFEALERPSQRFAELLARYAEPVGDALGASGTSASSLIAKLPPEGQARYIARLAEVDAELPTHVLRSISGAAARAPEAFTAIAERVLKATNQRDAGSFQIDPGELDAAALTRLLASVRAKDKLFARVSLLLAIWGTPACAAALAAFLGDPKRGRRCARWLAVLGAEGRKAARDVLAAPPKKAKEAALAKEHAEKVLALPETPQVLPALHAGNFVWSLDVQSFRLAETPAEKTEAPHPPIPLEAVTRALSGEPVAKGDLAPHHWADLLQIVARHPQLKDIPWAYERAAKKGLLGRGADPGSLLEAVRRFSFDFYVKDHYKSPLGLYSFLIGAGAPRELLLHVMGVYASVIKGTTVGQIDRHFTQPLAAFKPQGYEELKVLARHMELSGFHGSGKDELSRWPLLHRVEDVPLATAWTSPEPLVNFRLRARVQGASRITVTLRKRVTLTVDVERAQWSQSGLSGKKDAGPTAPPGEPALIELEVIRNALRFGVGGANVGNSPDGYLFEGVGKDAGPVVIAAEGEGARLVEAILTETRSMRDADDIADLLNEEDAKKIKNVAGTDSEYGALALAAEVSLGENEETRAAAQKALLGMGARGKPWIEALGLEGAAAPDKKKKKAGVRSFEEVLSDFAASQTGKKKKPLQRANLSDGVIAASFGNPESPKWRSGQAVSEDTVYLLPAEHHYGKYALDGPKQAIDALTGLPAVTTWNTRGDGEWVGKKKHWVIVSSDDLRQEQDEDYDTMSLVAAVWKVQEGVALAVFREGGDPLAKLMDLPEGWPKRQDWESMEIWIGE